ncbi:MAG TPA: O-antigen ligase family protein [Dokdonella sp.]
MLRLLLLFQIFYTVYQGHYEFASGIPGLNLANALFLLTLLLVLAAGARNAVTERALLRGPVLLFSAMLVVSFGIAQARAPGDLMTDVTYLKNALFPPLLYFLYLHCKQDLKNTRLLVIAVMAVAAIAAVQAIRQGFDYGLGNFVESHRASGPFGDNYRDANRAGVYYAMFLPMFVAAALFFRSRKLWRAGALGGVGLLALAVMFTYSRQAYFISLLGLAVLLLRRSVVLSVVIGVSLVLLASYLPESVTQRVEETQQKGPHGEERVDESTASRWEIWAGAMAMWRANPAGVGLNRFKDEIGKYSSFQHFDAHNFYVLTLAESGPQGLAALLLLVAATFRLARFLRRQAPTDDPEANALAIGFTVTTLCMALGNLYGSPFFETNVMGTYWVLGGLLERQARLRAQLAPAAQAALAPAPPSMQERFPLAARARGLPPPR